MNTIAHEVQRVQQASKQASKVTSKELPLLHEHMPLLRLSCKIAFDGTSEQLNR